MLCLSSGLLLAKEIKSRNMNKTASTPPKRERKSGKGYIELSSTPVLIFPVLGMFRIFILFVVPVRLCYHWADSARTSFLFPTKKLIFFFAALYAVVGFFAWRWFISSNFLKILREGVIGRGDIHANSRKMLWFIVGSDCVFI